MVVAGWVDPTIGLDERLGVDAAREWPALGLWDSQTAMSSPRRPGTGRVRSELGSVEEREWNMVVPPPRNADLRALSGVPPRGRDTAENAVDEGRDSSVLSVIRLKRARGSKD